MKNHAWLPVTLLLTVLYIPAVATAQEGADASRPEGEVRDVVHAFKAALHAGDSLAVLDLLHPEVRVYEGGHAETREQYRSGHLRSDIAFLGAVKTETTRDQVIVGSDVALYMSEYTVNGEYRGREIDAHGTETIALVPTDAGWRIRHIHWSSR
jgi:ketosteroid isomerase-like protein